MAPIDVDELQRQLKVAKELNRHARRKPPTRSKKQPVQQKVQPAGRKRPQAVGTSTGSNIAKTGRVSPPEPEKGLSLPGPKVELANSIFKQHYDELERKVSSGQVKDWYGYFDTIDKLSKRMEEQFVEELKITVKEHLDWLIAWFTGRFLARAYEVMKSNKNSLHMDFLKTKF